MARNMELLWW